MAWIGVILFSSTNLAQIWAEQAYQIVTGQGAARHPEHGTPYLLADKGFHVSLFCIFALLLSRTIRTFAGRPWKVVLAGAVLGSCSEYLQSFFPGRDPAVRDVFINIAGTTLGVFLYSRLTLKHSSGDAASTNLRVPAGTGKDGR